MKIVSERYLDVGSAKLVPIPFGVVSSGQAFTLKHERGKNVIVRCQPENTIVAPRYHSTDRTDDGDELQISLVTSATVRREVLGLLEQTHYRRSAPGVILAAHIKSSKATRDSAKDLLAGCAVLSRLRYAMPTRRIDYFRSRFKGINDDNLLKQKIAQMNILWLRRIATAPKYRGRGIAHRIAQHILTAREYFRPIPDFVEVITSQPQAEIVREGLGYGADFLIRAGYSLVKPEWRRRQEQWDPHAQAFVSTPVESFYYIYEYSRSSPKQNLL